MKREIVEVAAQLDSLTKHRYPVERGEMVLTGGMGDNPFLLTFAGLDEAVRDKIVAALETKLRAAYPEGVRLDRSGDTIAVQLFKDGTAAFKKPYRDHMVKLVGDVARQFPTLRKLSAGDIDLSNARTHRDKMALFRRTAREAIDNTYAALMEYTIKPAVDATFASLSAGIAPDALGEHICNMVDARMEPSELRMRVKHLLHAGITKAQDPTDPVWQDIIRSQIAQRVRSELVDLQSHFEGMIGRRTTFVDPVPETNIAIALPTAAEVGEAFSKELRGDVKGALDRLHAQIRARQATLFL